MHEIYKYLKFNSILKFSNNENKVKEIPWNFSKFLLNKDGKVYKYFPPTKKPIEMI